MKNTELMYELLPENLHPFVNCFEDLYKLDSAVCGKDLGPNMLFVDQVIDNFIASFSILHKTFGVSNSNKIHIIQSHLKDYLHKTKKGLGVHSDQLVEQMHQEVDRRVKVLGQLFFC